MTCVQGFAVVPLDGSETRVAMAALRGRDAAVIVWGVAGDHRQVMVNRGPYEAMRAEATRSLAAAGIETRGTLVDIAPVSSTPRAASMPRRPVAVAMARANAMRAAAAPIVAAGIRVKTVMTPAMALASLARLRRAIPSPGAPGILEAYVALDASATCIALVRNATLVAARELPWGYAALRGEELVPRTRDAIATRLGDELAEFLSIAGARGGLAQICICGGLPELRSMTMPLMERLDIEVEALDSLFGIDAGKLSASRSQFLERAAEWRLSWAAASDPVAPLNLLRGRHRQQSGRRFARAAVAAGILTGLGLGWQVAHSPLLGKEPIVEVADSKRLASFERNAEGRLRRLALQSKVLGVRGAQEDR